MKKLSLFFYLLLAVACGDKNNLNPDSEVFEDGLLISKGYLWNIETSDSKNTTNMSTVTPVIIHNDHILIGKQQGDMCQIAAVNCHTGAIKWVQDETPMFFSMFNAIITDNSFIYNLTNIGKVKSRNLETGEVNWGISFEHGISAFFTGNSDYFSTSSSGFINQNQDNLQSLWLGNTQTGEVREVTKPQFPDLELDYSKVGGIGGYHMSVPFTNKKGQLCILATGFFPLKEGGYFDFFDVYNVETKEKTFEHITLSSVATALPQIKDGVVYMPLFEEFCAYDLSTGEKLWGRNYETRFDENGFIIHDSTIFALQEGENDYLISLDRFSGRENWKMPARQSFSVLNYLDGVIYYSNGRLYAYDATNGQQLWSIESPDGTNFGFNCYAIPGKNGGKGKIIAGTGLQAYCYEAER